MAFKPQDFRCKVLPKTIAHSLQHFKLLGLSLSLGIGSSLLFADSAIAVETIQLQFQDRSVTVTLEEVRTFAETGEADAELSAFIDGSEEIADIVGTILTEEITLTPAFQERISRDIRRSSLGQFLLTQINQFIQGSTELTALENAIQASLTENNRLSILEIAENYTAPDVDFVTINLTEAGVVYRDVRGFVERVLPAIEVAREFLQDAICDCPTVTEVTAPAAAEDDDTPQSTLPTDEFVPVAASQIHCQPTGQPTGQPSALSEPALSEAVIESAAETVSEPTAAQLN
ncbi:alpha/beta hydrolase [Egbenema bharatensis]|uniref:alpha/beta hydrolase n=1 Tax=Egbenema bharatensis TaxID=3463334 RepID=UPI003A85719B